jgi:hypothetical protein
MSLFDVDGRIRNDYSDYWLKFIFRIKLDAKSQMSQESNEPRANDKEKNNSGPIIDSFVSTILFKK